MGIGRSLAVSASRSDILWNPEFADYALAMKVRWDARDEERRPERTTNGVHERNTPGSNEDGNDVTASSYDPDYSF